MIGIAIALVLMLGIGGTAVVADTARPGDALFEVDQTIEKMRLSLGNEDKKNELRIRFAEERVEEIEDLADEDEDDNDSALNDAEPSDATVTEIEAHIFANETIVKIEYNDHEKVFVTPAKTKEAIVTALSVEYPLLTKEFLEKTLSVEVEDRPSQMHDKAKSLSESGQVNVHRGIAAALTLLAGLKQYSQDEATIASITAITATLNAYLADLPSNATIEVEEDEFKIHLENKPGDDSDDDEDRIEVKQKNKDGTVKATLRTEEERIKIEFKNGILEIKTKLDHEGSDDDKEEDEDDDKEGDLKEVEAKIVSGATVVEIEFDDKKTTFTTSPTSREAIIGAILAKYPHLTAAQITAVLKIETEDHEDDGEDRSDEDIEEEDSKE